MLRSRSILLSTLLLSLNLFSQPSDPAVAALLDPPLERLFALSMSPGMSVAVVQGERIVYARGFGYADLASKRPVRPETYFYIASTTKSLTGFACALLVNEGALSYREKATTLVPGLTLHPSIDPSSVTLFGLLTLTHGIEGNGPVVFRTAFTGDHTKEQLLKLTGAHRPASSGPAFSYNNLGFNIAGFVLEAATNKSWNEVVHERVVVPLGLTGTTSWIDAVDAERLALPYTATSDGFAPAEVRKTDKTMHAAGGHYSTALDMAAWVGVHLNDGRWGGKQVFPANVVRDVRMPHVPQDRNFGSVKRVAWGIGWDIGILGGDTIVHRPGSFPGYFSYPSFIPSRNTGVVVFTNEMELGGRLAMSVIPAVYNALKGDTASNNAMVAQLTSLVPRGRQQMRDELARRAARPQDLPHPLSAYEGTFVNEEMGRLTSVVESGKLVFRIGGLRSVAEVFDNTKDQFRVELTGSGTVIQMRVKDGRAESAELMGSEFKRTDR